MSDLTERLRAVDHMSLEDCFLQSYLYGKAADEIDRLTRELAEARDKALEEAAKVADAMAKRRFTKDMREMLNLCAAAIRALKEKTE